jgi:hypothetical protein
MAGARMDASLSRQCSRGRSRGRRRPHRRRGPPARTVVRRNNLPRAVPRALSRVARCAKFRHRRDDAGRSRCGRAHRAVVDEDDAKAVASAMTSRRQSTRHPRYSIDKRMSIRLSKHREVVLLVIAITEAHADEPAESFVERTRARQSMSRSSGPKN